MHPVSKPRSLREDTRQLFGALGRFFKTLSLYLTAQETLDQRLQEAVQSGDIARVQKRAAEGGDVNYRSSWRGTAPLALAIDSGRADMVAVLLALGADPNQQNDYRDATVMGAAIKKGDPAILRLMLDAGGNPNAKTGSGVSGFAYAVAARNDAAADMLLSAGARPDAEPAGAWSALFYAARNNDAARVRQLLDLGVRTGLRDDKGRSVLKVAETAENFAVRDMIQAHIDAQVAPWQPIDENSIAHVRILRAQGYRLTEVFNFKTREATLITHNFETRLDSSAVRVFDAVANKALLAEAQSRLPKSDTAAKAAVAAPRG